MAHVSTRQRKMSTDRESLGAASVTGSDPRSQLLQEMREQNFDLIRFASYRTACKLRYVQKKCNREYCVCRLEF